MVTVFTSTAVLESAPDDSGPCASTTTTISLNNEDVDIYYPASTTCDSDTNAPYAAVGFAHGFSMFGLSNGAADNQGNGEHLASWGYVVAIPILPDDAEERVQVLSAVLDYLEAATLDSASPLYQMIDRERMSVVGYSLGGATALAISARESRIKTVVALDPVYHEGGFSGEGDPVWDPEAEAPSITVPVGILGAPADACNAESDYLEIYNLIGATHKAIFHIIGANHCAFADPGPGFCICGGESGPEITQLSQKYMTAWLNYYLQLKTGYYDYLYGIHADADTTDPATIIRTVKTAPRNITAQYLPEAILLQWELYAHPQVAGYQIFRRLPGENFSESPLGSVGSQNSYYDAGLLAGQTYIYSLRSVDPAGNGHQLSHEEIGEITAVPLETVSETALPLLTKP